ncbi:MAG: hypothetical protein IBX71_09000, partial [Candidatus Desulforudis sp.]|nr:hypothetical protein [Desulforudis sp.]
RGEKTVTETSSAALRRVWQQLDLTDFFQRELQDRYQDLPPDAPVLIEAMVFSHALRPTDTRPLSSRHHHLEPTELSGLQFSAADFYRTVHLLAHTRTALERHLFRKLCARFGQPSLLFLVPLRTDFVGHKYAVTPTGLTLETKTCRRPLNIMLTLFPPDLPIGFELATTGAPLNSGFNDWLKKQDCTHYCLLLEDFDLRVRPRLHGTVRYIAALPVNKFAWVSVSPEDAWQTSNVIIDRKCWIMDLLKPDARYVITHELQEKNGQDFITQNLVQAERQFGRLKTAVRHRRLTREKTILQKAAEIMERYNCRHFFHCSFNPAERAFEYTRLNDVVKQHRILRRTRILKTSVLYLSPRDIVSAHRDGAILKQAFQPVDDLLRIQVTQLQVKLRHNELDITGQVVLHMLSQTLNRMSARAPGGEQ